MDEDEYRSAYQEINPSRCVFEKALLTRTVHCQHAEFFCLAERYGVACQFQGSQKRCSELLALIRQKSSFALGLREAEERLPHAKEMKVQMGGLLGLAKSLGMEVQAVTDNIDAVVAGAFASCRDVQDLPFGDIVQSVVKHQGRRRRK